MSANINTITDVNNYLGLFPDLRKQLLEQEARDLKAAPDRGKYPTKGFRGCRQSAKESWFGFRHFYSDSILPEKAHGSYSATTRTTSHYWTSGGNHGPWALPQYVLTAHQCGGSSMDLRHSSGDHAEPFTGR